MLKSVEEHKRRLKTLNEAHVNVVQRMRTDALKEMELRRDVSFLARQVIAAESVNMTEFDEHQFLMPSDDDPFGMPSE